MFIFPFTLTKGEFSKAIEAVHLVEKENYGVVI